MTSVEVLLNSAKFLSSIHELKRQYQTDGKNSLKILEEYNKILDLFHENISKKSDEIISNRKNPSVYTYVILQLSDLLSQIKPTD